MKRVICSMAAILCLSGCAYWDSMSPEQQQLVIGTAVVSLIVGYHANDGDTVVVQSPMPQPSPLPGECKHHC